jgi:hypothetical protein
MQIYKTTNLINGKIYIGKEKRNDPEYYGSGKILKEAIKKYGKENFQKDILIICDSNQELNEQEKFWISYFRSLKNKGYELYNISSGGDWGDTFTNNPRKEEIREKVRNSVKNRVWINNGIKEIRIFEIEMPIYLNKFFHKGRLPISDKTRNKMGESRKGKKHSILTKIKQSIVKKGKKVSEKTRKLLSERNKGKEVPFERRLKIKEGMKKRKEKYGYVNSPETREKLSKVLKGKNNWSKDRRWMNNNKENIMVEIKNIEQKITEGFTFGRIFHNKV